MVQMTDARRKERFVDVSDEELDKALNAIYSAGNAISHIEGLRRVYRAGQGTYEDGFEPALPFYAGTERRHPDSKGKHPDKGRRVSDTAP